MTPAAEAASDPDGKTLLGHPRGLAILFLTEMWERFSYYGMRSLLVLYLTQHFLFGQAEAQGIYAAYAALVYLMPLIGGAIADRYLGARKAVIIGALLLVAGHFTMTFEGTGGRAYIEVEASRFELVAEGRGQHRALFILEEGKKIPLSAGADGIARADGVTTGAFPAVIAPEDYRQVVAPDAAGQAVLYWALALIAIGVGFLKPNISSVVGALYAPGDPRRDGGFTLFYVGINIGAFTASAACAFLGITYGWAYGFGLAGLGMAAGLAIFIAGRPWLDGCGEPPDLGALRTRRILGIPLEAVLWIGGILAVIPAWLLLQRHALVAGALLYLVPLIFAGLFAYVVLRLRGVERSRMLVALILTIVSVLFWALFEQAGSSLTLFANDFTAMPRWFNAGMTQTFNPGVIIVAGPAMAALWVWLANRRLEPTTPVKFAIALAALGSGFLVLAWAATTQAGSDLRTPLVWLFIVYVLHTVGELCLSPVGLSMITKLSVARMVGLMMGVWFMASSLAHTVAGLIAQLTASETVAGVIADRSAALAGYIEVYREVGLAAGGAAVAMLLLAPLLQRLMAGIR